ncbi:MAG: rcsC [Bacteroidota bacterium]|jgi:PAS domain S-box-containing protein|nr:rcsC [Bacteroidota bacterium]
MERSTATETDLYFLSGGGEMGALTRKYDWSKSILGSPEYWPQNLKLTLSMMLSSKFPMFLWWGDDMIQFYNDAYRPSLGNNAKHPQALGQKGEECWPEIWETIYPLIQDVRKGNATWSEDQLIPIYRNGRLEDVYWTFGYSPIFNEERKVEGILVVCTETTEKILAQKRIQESEQRFRTMAEGTDILIATSDESSNATYFNKAWSVLTGKPLSRLLEYGWVEIIHQDDRDKFLDLYKTSFANKSEWRAEFRVINADGNYSVLLAKGIPRIQTNGEFEGYISTSIDITDRKQNEDRLVKSEEETRSLVESAPFPIGVYLGKEMRIKFVNQSIIDVWGKGNDVVGKLYSEVLPELENQSIYQQLDDVYETGIPFHAKNQRVDLVVNGKLQAYYFNYSFTPLFDSTGKVYGVMNTAAETTDLNRALQRVEQSESSLRQTILQAPVAMCILKEEDLKIELANERMYELWGKTDRISGKPLFEGLPEAKNQGFEELLKGVYHTGKAYVAEGIPANLPRKHGIETVYVNMIYAPYREENGVISGILVVATDVTQQIIAHRGIEEVVAKRTKQLAEANQELQRSNAELAQFAYIASHDLQEPLRKISTFTQMLETRIMNSLDDQSKKYLSKINSASSRMNTLIRDVLSYSELVKDSQVFKDVDLNQIVENTITDYELLIEQKHAVINYKNLPVVEAIPLQMSQLVGNILGNSLKFAKKDVAPSITIHAALMTEEEKKNTNLEASKEYYKIQFSDNGIGFKEEHAEQIFNIFQRLHRKSEYEGTGIGLAMCKKIALNHHGDINAKGTSENGAVFNVYLPVKQS